MIVAIILQTKIEWTSPLPNGMWPMQAATAGYAILGAGITTGFSNLACGYALALPFLGALQRCASAECMVQYEDGEGVNST